MGNEANKQKAQNLKLIYCSQYFVGEKNTSSIYMKY